MSEKFDILIPVYNEGEAFLEVLQKLAEHVKSPIRVLLCHDTQNDTTLGALTSSIKKKLEIVPVLNRSKGAHAAVCTGFEFSRCPAVLVFPGDDVLNAGKVDSMIAQWREGSEIVVASRFIPGGAMQGCPWLKALLVRASAFVLYHVGRLPAHDASNGFRLFSRRVLDTIQIESTEGFTYSIELLAKTHRLRWKITEVPVLWKERKIGKSRFRVIQWIPAYLKWFFYIFETTYLMKGPGSVPLRTYSRSTSPSIVYSPTAVNSSDLELK